jgi:hypothetical protein
MGQVTQSLRFTLFERRFTGEIPASDARSGSQKISEKSVQAGAGRSSIRPLETITQRGRLPSRRFPNVGTTLGRRCCVFAQASL